MLRKKRTRLQKLETTIDDAEKAVAELEQQYTDPEIAADYERMLQLNAEVDAAKHNLEESYNEWVLLNDELSAESE